MECQVCGGKVKRKYTILKLKFKNGRQWRVVEELGQEGGLGRMGGKYFTMLISLYCEIWGT